MEEDDLDPGELTDRDTERLRAEVGHEDEVVVNAEARKDAREAQVVDLMEVLKRQLQGGDEDEGVASYPESLAELTRDELYQEARRLDVPGRSKMSKDELVRALQATRRAD